MKFDDRDDIIQLTPLWTGDRFDDGRPRVSDDILRRMQYVTTEEAWGVCWNKGYQFQFEGNWTNLHPERTLVGRAVTGVFVPYRPDLHDALTKQGIERESRIGAMNSWVIQTLVQDDAIVIDLFGKIYKGTYSGGNLSTAIATRTGRGQVIYGGIRDAQQVMEIPNLLTFCKGVDPTAIADVTLIGMNVPCRIGGSDLHARRCGARHLLGRALHPAAPGPRGRRALGGDAAARGVRLPAAARGDLQLQPDGYQVDAGDRGGLRRLALEAHPGGSGAHPVDDVGRGAGVSGGVGA